MADLTLGAVALLPVVISCSRKLRNAYKSIKYARSELEGLTDEMDIFTGTYTAFLRCCAKEGKQQKRVSVAKEKLVIWTRQAIQDYKKLLHKVDALARHPVHKHTVTELAFAQLKWPFRKNHVVYLRASLNVARQSLVSFTNIHNMAILDEQLDLLKAVISRRERKEIEKEYGMTKEELEGLRDTYEMQQSGLPILLQEAQNKVLAYTNQSQDYGVIQQMEQLREFSESVNRYVDRVLPVDRTGNRPPRPSRRSRVGSGRHQNDSSVTSQTTATVSTTSTQPSHHRNPVPESPPTSPEPSIARSPIVETQPEEEETTSILNFCQKCSGTCINTEAHSTSIRPPTPGPRTYIAYAPIQGYDARDTRIASHSQSSSRSQRQSDSANGTPASRPRPNSLQRYPPKPSVEPADEERPTLDNDRASSRENQNGPKDEIAGENVPTEEQATGSKSSIWRGIGAFEGDMPKGLRIRRQRSRSPQDFW
ncbi:hypothetical protein GT037_001442 [Alternaria burnsii]|uniref:Fungal N-terminal domain-containing protein n=1 Tax=Alternaria burnsii TaxID=1187904 RepID=A0A8H7B8M8_9PLEO|nr:uncharacterized protein GT037_001442 [Alternaria burnsii]KAF7679791.1 hypothetical protein GT037_001442 [Alternaria burnsii]CAI9629258.1 unnamed protein product [Alternaria burnsii]